MHVISYRRIHEFCLKHADCRAALDNWYKVASQAKWFNLVDIQSIFLLAEAVGNFTVFRWKNDFFF